MAENRDYISRPDEMGNIHISEEVLAAIAAAAALEVEGVGSLAPNLGNDIAQLLGKRNMARGIRIHMEEDEVVVELSILIKYGGMIMEVAQKVQDGVSSAVEATSGLSVKAVNVHVAGITFEKEPKEPKAPRQ